MPKSEFDASFTAKEKKGDVTVGSGVNASLGGVSGANWNSTTVGSSGWSTQKGQNSDLWGLSGNKSQTQHIGPDGLNQSSSQGIDIAGLGGVSAQSSSAIGPDGISMSEHYNLFGKRFGYDYTIPTPNVTASFILSAVVTLAKVIVEVARDMPTP